MCLSISWGPSFPVQRIELYTRYKNAVHWRDWKGLKPGGGTFEIINNFERLQLWERWGNEPWMWWLPPNLTCGTNLVGRIIVQGTQCFHGSRILTGMFSPVLDENVFLLTISEPVLVADVLQKNNNSNKQTKKWNPWWQIQIEGSSEIMTSFPDST